jgi:hypothetical protein
MSTERVIKFQSVHKHYKTGEIRFLPWGPIEGGGLSAPSHLSEYTVLGHRQFTGLQDTIEDPIYERDVLLYKDKDWEVQFNQDYAGYCLVRSLSVHGENESIRFDCDVACRAKIIGNIYSSPSSIEESKAPITKN